MKILVENKLSRAWGGFTLLELFTVITMVTVLMSLLCSYLPHPSLGQVEVASCHNPFWQV